MKLNGKVAIVTGSASGFGRATAARLAEEGASVVVADLDAVGGAETVDLVTRVGAQAELVLADISTLAGASETVDRAVARFGGLDILVNNAGIAQGTERNTWDCDEELWDRIIQVNLKSVYACTKAAVPQMRARGGGAIVSVASIAASVCVGGAAYAASKGGIVSFTRHVSREVAAEGIRVNCVSPGFMRTPMSSGVRQGLNDEEQNARIEGFGRLVPMRTAGSVLDIANAIVYLASDDSAYVTGQELVVDGGYLVR